MNEQSEAAEQTEAQSNAPSNALLQQTIWLTRPQQQSEELAATLHELGARTFSLPLLEIVSREPDGETRTRLLNLDQYDLLFYVSSNAAKAGLNCIDQYWPQYPPHILNFAVGPTTAGVLQAYGLQVAYPEDRMDSESMLALPQLQNISGKKALIIRGVGGREILASGLREQGVTVDYAELYERRCPEYSDELLCHDLLQYSPDAIVISSGEALDNLKSLFSRWNPEWQQLPLYVASERLADYAGNLGFSDIVTMAGAADTAIIAGLIRAFEEKA